MMLNGRHLIFMKNVDVNFGDDDEEDCDSYEMAVESIMERKKNNCAYNFCLGHTLYVKPPSLRKA